MSAWLNLRSTVTYISSSRGSLAELSWSSHSTIKYLKQRPRSYYDAWWEIHTPRSNTWNRGRAIIMMHDGRLTLHNQIPETEAEQLLWCMMGDSHSTIKYLKQRPSDNYDAWWEINTPQSNTWNRGRAVIMMHDGRLTLHDQIPETEVEQLLWCMMGDSHSMIKYLKQRSSDNYDAWWEINTPRSNTWNRDRMPLMTNSS